MDNKKRTALVILSAVLALGMVLSTVQPLPAGAAQWLNAVWARQPGPGGPAGSSLNGVYTGQVKLSYVLPGVYSDSLPAPEPGSQPNLGTIDLSLQLTQEGAAVEGYVNLEHTLVFTAENTVGSTAFGPAVTGSFDGTNLSLESERVFLVSAGQRMQRQFQVVGRVTPGDVKQISGEYRETLWGYGLQPLTIVGSFTLDWAAPVMNKFLYMPMVKG